MVKLPDGTEIDPTQIDGIKLSKRGAPLGRRVVSIPAGTPEDLTVPEDVLIIRLKDESEISVRGSEAEIVFGQLNRIQEERRLDFRVEKKRPTN
jgi:hypothetical protein